MILHPRSLDGRAPSRSSRTVLRHAVKAVCEQLENRRLLTTIHGGDTVEFQDYGASPVRVTVVGPTSAQFELIGATSAPSSGTPNGQTFSLNDIPVQITTAAGQVINELGGVGGVDGVNPIGTITGGDSLTDLFGGPGGGTIEAPSAGINFTALSSNSKGVTWGLNLLQVQGMNQSKLLELANFDYRNSSDATVFADLAPRVIQLIGTLPSQDTTNVTTNSINSVIACDFLPTNDNLLYIGVNVTVPRFDFLGTANTTTDAVIPFLFVYNFATGTLNFANPNQPEFFSQSVGGTMSFADLAPTVLGFSFASDDTLVASVTGRDIAGTGDQTGVTTVNGIVSIPDPNNPVFRDAQSRLNPQPTVQPINLDLKPVNDFHGLEVVPGDDGFVYGISSVAEVGSGPELLHVQLTGPNAGVAIDYGPLPDPQDKRTPPRGTNLGDLDWNPVLVNPFHNPGVTPRKGVLISEDTTTDELVVVDQRERYPQTNLYAIYGTNTTNDTSISIARVPAITAKDRPMEPFTGAAGPIRTTNAQNGVLSDGTTPTEDGTVFIGALTRNLIPDSINAKEDDLPVRRIRKTPSQTFGNLPKTTKYVYAGITVEGNIHNVLVGGTVTGNVDVEGSADLLYAGDWLTGDAGGILQLDDINDDINGADINNNFFVHGDLRTLASGSDFGTLDNDAGVNKPDYLSGFNLHVGGRLGDIWSPSGSIEGSINASNTFTGSSQTQEEIEDKRGPTKNSQTYFQGFDTGDAPSLGDLMIDAGQSNVSGAASTRSGQFSNDTFTTPQYLATAQNNALGSDEVVAVNGSLTKTPTITDATDYYAVALMAGQSVTVQLTSDGSANVGVFDPDGRLIASDHRGFNTTDIDYVTGQPFRFTADRPGAYRFAVGFSDDGDFTGATTVRGSLKYTLRITGLDNIGIGGIVAGANIVTYEEDLAGVSVHNGDLGAVTAAGQIFDLGLPNIAFSTSKATTSTFGDVYLVNHGNLRSIESPSVGVGTAASGLVAATVSNGINLIVPRGSVGLLRATGTAGATDTGTGTSSTAPDVLAVNDALGSVMIGSDGNPDATYAVGGQYELVDSEAEYAANLSADGAIGTVRTAQMTVVPPPLIIANADQAGSDGVIDLIDVNDNMGTLQGGGPSIYTGPGGNVRYMRAGGTVFNNRKFGGGPDEPILMDPGATAKLTDDSGTPVKITPTPLVINPSFNPTDGVAADASQYLDPGQLSVLTYSTNDSTKGGVVIMRVSVDPNLPGSGYPVTGTTAKTLITANHGIDFDSGSSGNLSSVEIGEVDTFGTGRAITETDPGTTTTNPDGTTTTFTGSAPELTVPTQTNSVANQTAPDTTTPINLTFDGKSRIDVYSIVGRAKPTTPGDDESTTDIAAAAGPGAIDEINNDTDGEVVNVDAGSVASISAQWVGIARSHTGVDPSSADNAVNGFTVLDDGGSNATTVTGGAGSGGLSTSTVTTPFVQQRNLIHIHGDTTSYLVTVDARKGVGNIWVEGIIGTITANSNKQEDPGGGFEGIDGPIVATAGGADTNWDARIQAVNIGDGVEWGGSGDVPFAGIFAGDTIGTVQGSGVGHDIHGIIHAGSDATVSPTDGDTIGSIKLSGGALISANIEVTSSFNDWRSGNAVTTAPELGDTLTKPLFEIGSIDLKGIGGIIGTFIEGADLGPIDINGGFGFINSELDSLSNNQVAGIDTTGYGIRGSFFEGGEDMQEMIARGTGKALNVNSFTPSVVQSRDNTIDPFTGREYTPLNDLDKLLGTTKKHPIVKSVSASGVIENVTANFGHNLGTVSAYEIRGRNGGATQFNFSNAVNKIMLTGGTDEFTLKTGGLNKFTTGDDVSHTLIGVAGPITQVNIGGTLRGTSTVSATGPNGTISSLRTKRSLFGVVNGNIGIGTITVGTDLGSPSVATIGNLDLLDVMGSVLDGAVVSNFKKGVFVPLRKIGDLEVGGNVESGSLIRAKAINKQHVGGTISGSIIIGA